jgi:hypothetical protein
MTLIFTRLLLTFRNKTIQMRITVPESTYKRTFFAYASIAVPRCQLTACSHTRRTHPWASSTATARRLTREKLSLVRQNSLNDSVNWSHLQYCGSNFFNALLSSSNGSRCAVFHWCMICARWRALRTVFSFQIVDTQWIQWNCLCIWDLTWASWLGWHC